MTELTPEDLMRRELRETRDLIGAMLEDPEFMESTASATDLVVDAYRSGGKLLVFGNGGSAADSNHIAAEFVGRFLTDRRPLAALSLSANQSAITAIANDYGFEHVFARQLEGLGNDGDVAIGFTTSGQSRNVVKAFEFAAEAKITTIAMTGSDPGAAGEAADHVIAVPSASTPHIQQAHMMVAHVICGQVENELLSGKF